MEEESGEEFPGFQIGVHKEEYVFKRPLSRLQRRAPCPLQLTKAMGCNLNSSSSSTPQSSSSSSSSFSSFYQSKDPIPLLSPLVLPSMLESSYTAKSH
ncbi:hypothetical protein Pint_23450 [Pistacia integerrima]|uniref:Uncharacterized protein n=1 Tax=Pistacia integerrima TaxID=434235 RepID=A0ACC0YKN2_9ROSI|nr:hypothetical protein Pint_23450 [Pistacia integerrima]